ncbi:MAG: C1 family peptidase [Opitutaceae bacterium]|nr:C1 family peptidase [Opitutaceae bacterium]
MPSVSYAAHGYELSFDARPDRIDLRDRPYQPKLTNLPPSCPDAATIKKWLPKYTQRGFILDQGSDGACTGFGLAAVVNFLLFHATDIKPVLPAHPFNGRSVSPGMLYQLAKIYDEWEGEDYVGSSCRGAMKGWHKHGVCSDRTWGYKPGQWVDPNPNWVKEAPQVVLGAYYRIDIASASDLQAAIAEVGAVYASGAVHEGWFEPVGKAGSLPTIPWTTKQKQVGGHAFALVGYTPEGLIVQNSWGTSWGMGGFALLTWADWVTHAMDAWVATLGAAFSFPSQLGVGKAKGKGTVNRPIPVSRRYRYESSSLDGPVGIGNLATANPRVPPPLTRDQAEPFGFELFNDGRLIHRSLDEETALTQAASRIEAARRWLMAKPPAQRRLVLFAHGGLNSRTAGWDRARVMAPLFLANDIYPLFVVWGTGFGETIFNIIRDLFPRLEKELPAQGRLAEWIADHWDNTLEFLLRPAGRPLWTEMRENAARSIQNEGGMRWLAAALRQLSDAVPGLQIHLIGHSAGGILLSHFIQRLQEEAQPVASLHLYAPAASVALALDTLVPAEAAGVINWDTCYLDALDNACERADNVGGIYRKSLLYLVSRALDDDKSMPLIGLQTVWDPTFDDQASWSPYQRGLIHAWRAAALTVQRTFVPRGSGTVRETPRKLESWGHGLFDNDLATVNRTIGRIRGSEPLLPATDLTGP